MDVVTLTNSLAGYLIPVLPYLIKAGEKAAEEAGGKIAGEAWGAAKTLWSRMWPKVEAKPAALEAIKDVIATPDDADTQAALRKQFSKLLNEDSAWATEIASLLAQAKAAGGSRVSADRGGVAFGDNASNNTVITGGVRGDVVLGNKRDK
ncbi:MAG TPA: hypothetical protein VJ302_09375 [Blastocatellia bacterium]|nr:hypothetical protein [Blastocatellia bacterium]